MRIRRLSTVLATGALALTATAGPASYAAGPSSPPYRAQHWCERTLPVYPVLRPGARRPAVRTLQCVLNDDGFGPVVVDGVYGPRTRAAVRRVEAGFEGPPLHPGRVDHGYWVLLLSHTLPDRAFRLGDAGHGVRTLQRALRAAGAQLAVDASFGPQTRAAVRAFQRANHLRPTGVVDAGTRFLLHMGAVIEKPA